MVLVSSIEQFRTSQVAQWIKNLPAMQETLGIWVQFLDQKDPIEEGTATHSHILAWRISWTEEPGRQQSSGSQRVRHDWSNIAHIHIQQSDICVYCKTVTIINLIAIHHHRVTDFLFLVITTLASFKCIIQCC